MKKYFKYGKKETDYLKKCDKKLAALIDKVGHVDFECHEDLFSGMIYIIIGQQISMKVQEAVWQRVTNIINPTTPDTILTAGYETLHGCGMSYRKAEYIMNCALKIKSGKINLEHIKNMSDNEAIEELIKLKGVGVWTAEMLLLMCLMRNNILSYNDLGIRNGLKLVYHHKTITRELFEKYRKRFSPYGSIASFYLWAAGEYK